MSLKYVWERSEKGLDLGMGGSGLDHSVMLQRMNLQTPQTQYVVFERGVRDYHFFSCFCYVTQITRISLVSLTDTVQENHSKINARIRTRF